MTHTDLKTIPATLQQEDFLDDFFQLSRDSSLLHGLRVGYAERFEGYRDAVVVMQHLKRRQRPRLQLVFRDW